MWKKWLVLIPRPKSIHSPNPEDHLFGFESICDKGDRIKNICLAMCNDELQADY
jgi:hypothetical protein